MPFLGVSSRGGNLAAGILNPDPKPFMCWQVSYVPFGGVSFSSESGPQTIHVLAGISSAFVTAASAVSF